MVLNLNELVVNLANWTFKTGQLEFSEADLPSKWLFYPFEFLMALDVLSIVMNSALSPYFDNVLVCLYHHLTRHQAGMSSAARSIPNVL